MKNKDVEIRSNADTVEVNDGDSRVITGYAIRFNKLSQVLRGYDGDFVEEIAPEAVTQDLIDRSDVRCLFNHDNSKLLARSTHGKGTLKLTIDDKGLRYSFAVPNVSYANDLYELVKRGDIVGSSFAFRAYSPGSVEYSKSQNGQLLRRVKKIDELFDVSPVIDPAYQQTSVNARSINTSLDPDPVETTPTETLRLRIKRYTL